MPIRTTKIKCYEETIQMYEKWLVDTLSYLVSVGIFQLASIVVAIIVFFYQYSRDNKNKKIDFKDRMNRISNLLLLDLSVLEGSRGKNPDVQIVLTPSGEYIEDHISTEHYESFVYSGLITYFKQETQLAVTHFYHHIMLHNKRIWDMGEMVNSRLNSGKYNDQDRKDLEESIAWKINQEQLIGYDKEIKEQIPIVKKLLNAELKRHK